MAYSADITIGRAGNVMEAAAGAQRNPFGMRTHAQSYSAG